MTLNQLYFSLADEVLSYLMGMAALADCIFNRNWRRYKLLGLIMGVLGVYWVNTILFRSYNTPLYVTFDYLMMLKPFLPLCVFYGMGIELTPKEKQATRWACYFNIALLLICLPLGELRAQQYILSYIAFFGQTCISVALIYLWVSIDDNGKISQSTLLFIVFTLLLGIWCGRSKYYGECILFFFFLFIYRPGIVTKMSFRNMIVLIILFGIILAVIWKKLTYYYLNPDIDMEEAEQSVARMALLLGLYLSLCEYPVLGAGLASFGSTPSVWNYSGFYIETGLDKVWGLSPTKNDFICDNFLATIGGEFGALGIILFLYLSLWLYRRMRPFLHTRYPRYKYYFICGVVAILSSLIENSNGNLFMTPGAITIYSMIGSLAAHGNKVARDESENKSATLQYISEKTNYA